MSETVIICAGADHPYLKVIPSLINGGLKYSKQIDTSSKLGGSLHQPIHADSSSMEETGFNQTNPTDYSKSLEESIQQSIQTNYSSFEKCGLHQSNQSLSSNLNKEIANQIIFVGVDRGALHLIQAGYQLDYAVGDFDSVSPQELAVINDNSKLMYRVQAEKDDTDTELGFQWICQNHPQAQVYFLGAIGESTSRFDHKIANLYLIYQERFTKIMQQTRIIERDLMIDWYGPGTHFIEPPQVIPDYLSIIPMTPVEGFEIRGAKYELAKTDINYPRAFVSNEYKTPAESVKISLGKGIVMVQHVIERKV